jgi:hypothetical protein
MKKISVIKAALATMSLAASASMCLAAAPAGERPVRFVLTGGITAGGDTIAKVEYSNGDSAKIKGGGLVQLGAGLQFQPNAKPFSVLATINYHVDNATAKNGDARFDRIPVELLGFYHLNSNWRIGGGWRHVINPRFTADFDYQPSITVHYKDADSLVLQVGFGSERFWGGLRYVNESYKAESGRINNSPALRIDTSKDDGSHIGLIGYVAF